MADRSGRLPPTRLEQIAQSLSIAAAAISAGLALYRGFLALKRESADFGRQEVRLQNIESQLSQAEEKGRLDLETQRSLAKQLTESVS